MHNMARAMLGVSMGAEAVKADGTSIDTRGYGQVRILLDVTAGSPSLTVKGSEDNSSWETIPAEHLVDNHGNVADVEALSTGPALLFYIGWMPYIQVTPSNAVAYVELDEARDPTGPQPTA